MDIRNLNDLQTLIDQMQRAKGKRCAQPLGRLRGSHASCRSSEQTGAAQGSGAELWLQQGPEKHEKHEDSYTGHNLGSEGLREYISREYQTRKRLSSL